MSEEEEKVEEKPEGKAEKRYTKLSEVPAYARDTIDRLIDMDIIKGTENGLDLSEDMVRLLVMLDRAEVFKKSS